MFDDSSKQKNPPSQFLKKGDFIIIASIIRLPNVNYPQAEEDLAQLQ